MSGIEWLTTSRNLPDVVIVSSHRQYAVDAFEVDVVDYLLKPVSYGRFLKAVDRVLNHSSEPVVDPDDHVFLKTKGRLVRLDLKDILYVEAQSDYALIHTEKEQYLVHGTMKSFEKKLPANDFIRVHRSYIVRQDKIDDLEESSIVIGRQVIPVGASYRDKVLERLPRL
jgi:DNA-binding LytR/AlgR family response regulator